jgi:arachidonate 15-lipoxygenase
MSAFLPQRDPKRASRDTKLSSARKEYAYSYTHISPLAILDRVPFKDEFSVTWLKQMAGRVMTALENRAELELDKAFSDVHMARHGLLSRLVDQVESAVERFIHGLKQMVSDVLRFDQRIGVGPLPAKALKDFAGLFRKIGLPPVAKDYQDDWAFARMRLAGPNPVMLRRLAARDERLPLTDADFKAAVPTDSLDAALAEGRLFLADYADLNGADPGDYPHGPKYVYAPLALFVLDKTMKQLRPVAIQCQQRPGPDNPIFTPADGTNWLIAKTIVEIADGNVHEAATHLGRTHLFMEPFVVTTYRQLAPNHPLAMLLGPHFEGTLAINEASWRHLIANKGAVEKLFSVSIGSARKLAADSVQSARVTDVLLPKTLAARGVADAAVLPNYPYRDDAMLYWAAIREWVSAYLRIYYPTPQDLAEDDELQAWGRELASQGGGRLSGMPNDGTFRTDEELTAVVTLVIFTCSVQHAAVNFPQYDLMSYVPNMPLASYRPAPKTKTGASEADYLAMMPPLDMAELQAELGYLLGTLHYTQLGQYPEGRFTDPKVAAPLARFQQRLDEVGQTIAERNKTRRPYEFLVPSGVPQSINV